MSFRKTEAIVIAAALLAVATRATEVEPNGTTAQANMLVLDSTGHASITGKISPRTDLDVFRFTTPAFSGRGNLTVTMTPTAPDHELDAVLELQNANGASLVTRDFGSDNAPESLTAYDLGGQHTFYVRCSSADSMFSGPGDYTLKVSLTVTPGLFGFVRKPGDPTDYLVGISAFDEKLVDPNKRTWIVIHGLDSSPSNPNINAAAKALFDRRPDDQALTLDWSSVADAGVLGALSAESAIVPVAEWSATALTQYGFSGTNLNLIGHSFGSYVADELAHRISGGVRTIVALDPAADVPGGYDPVANDEVDFARDSAFSWAFHASSLGNEITPTRADEAFIVDSGLFTTTAHAAVVYLFAYFILNPNDPVGRLFLLDSLLMALHGPWLPNQYTSSFLLDSPVTDYEAVITSTNSGMVPSRANYVPLPRISIANGFGLLTLSWATNYPSFTLESSASLGASAKWDAVPLTVTVRGASNVVSLHDHANRFFRLKRP